MALRIFRRKPQPEQDNPQALPPPAGDRVPPPAQISAGEPAATTGGEVAQWPSPERQGVAATRPTPAPAAKRGGGPAKSVRPKGARTARSKSRKAKGSKGSRTPAKRATKAAKRKPAGRKASGAARRRR